MRKLLAAVVVVIPLLLGAVALWVWVTIPETPDPTALPSHVFEPPTAAYFEAIQEGRSIARTLVADEKLPGLSLAVSVQGEIVWAEGFRWADMGRETPVTPATLFRIGAISETVTAAAAGLLAQRGQLDLDAPIQHYLPDFPEKQWPISTRQLMAHTAGIRAHRGEGGIFQGVSCNDDAERLALFADDGLQSRPGTQHRYSTYNWVLVGAVVAAAAEEPLFNFVQREILTTLGMRDTIPDIAAQGGDDRAHLYYPRLVLDPRYGLHDAPSVDLSCYLAAVGFWSTPSDLVRLGSAMIAGTLLDPETVDELLKPVRLASGALTGEALGWTVGSALMGAGGVPTRMVGQGLGDVVLRSPLSVTTVGGQVAGGTASLLVVPDHHIAIAVATNVSGSKNAPLLATRLADTFLRFQPAP